MGKHDGKKLTSFHSFFNVCHPEVFNTYINIQWCVSTEIQPFNTGDKNLKVRQEYNISIRKASLTKRNITA